MSNRCIRVDKLGFLAIRKLSIWANQAIVSRFLDWLLPWLYGLTTLILIETPFYFLHEKDSGHKTQQKESYQSKAYTYLIFTTDVTIRAC